MRNCDPWVYGLLTLYGRSQARVGFDRLLDEPHTIHSVRDEVIDGRKLVRVDLSHELARLEIWFDPSVNYLIRQVHHRDTNSKGIMKSRVVEFREVTPGLHFPAKVEAFNWGDSTADRIWLATFTNLQLNQPIPAEQLRVKFPPNMLIHDFVRKAVFVTDSTGSPTLPAKTRDGQRITLATDGKPTIAEISTPSPSSTEMMEQTREEPKSWTRWILPVALALLAMAAVAWTARKWRYFIGRRPDETIHDTTT